MSIISALENNIGTPIKDFLTGGGSSNTGTGSAYNIQSGNANLLPSSSPYSRANPANVALENQNQSQINANNVALSNSGNQLAALEKSIQAEMQANTPGIAPTLNLNAINAQAKSQAANSVNPLYSQYLNEYNQELAANQQGAQAQNQLNLQSEQSALGNTLAQNQQAQTYAGQQNAGTQANINAEATNYQLNSANAQTAKLATLQGQLGSGNLSATGLGGQQLYQAENARNIADAQQQGQFQYQRNTSDLSTQDTFAQLAQSSSYATTAEGQQEAQTNFNLNDYLRQAAFSDSQYQQALAVSQQNATNAATWNLQAQNITNQINGMGLTGKNLQAANQAYAPYMSQMAAPSAPTQSDYLTAYGATV